MAIGAWDSGGLLSCKGLTGNFSGADDHGARRDVPVRSLLCGVGVPIIIHQGLTSYHLVLVLSRAARWQQAVQTGSLPPAAVVRAPVPVGANVEEIPPEPCSQPRLIPSRTAGWARLRHRR